MVGIFSNQLLWMGSKINLIQAEFHLFQLAIITPRINFIGYDTATVQTSEFHWLVNNVTETPRCYLIILFLDPACCSSFLINYLQTLLHCLLSCSQNDTLNKPSHNIMFKKYKENQSICLVRQEAKYHVKIFRGNYNFRTLSPLASVCFMRSGLDRGQKRRRPGLYPLGLVLPHLHDGDAEHRIISQIEMICIYLKPVSRALG